MDDDDLLAAIKGVSKKLKDKRKSECSGSKSSLSLDDTRNKSAQNYPSFNDLSKNGDLVTSATFSSDNEKENCDLDIYDFEHQTDQTAPTKSTEIVSQAQEVETVSVSTDEDIYGDLESSIFAHANKEEERTNYSNKTLMDKLKVAEKQIEYLEHKNKGLVRENKNYSTNISSLYITAKAEIDKKNFIIKQLQTKLQDLTNSRLSSQNSGINMQGIEDALKCCQEASRESKATIIVDEIAKVIKEMQILAKPEGYKKQFKFGNMTLYFHREQIEFQGSGAVQMEPAETEVVPVINSHNEIAKDPEDPPILDILEKSVTEKKSNDELSTVPKKITVPEINVSKETEQYKQKTFRNNEDGFTDFRSRDGHHNNNHKSKGVIDAKHSSSRSKSKTRSKSRSRSPRGFRRIERDRRYKKTEISRPGHLEPEERYKEKVAREKRPRSREKDRGRNYKRSRSPNPSFDHNNRRSKRHSDFGNNKRYRDR